jgi:hypothetical protein
MIRCEIICQTEVLIILYFRDLEIHSSTGTTMLILTLIASPLKMSPDYQSWPVTQLGLAKCYLGKCLLIELRNYSQ